MKSAQREGRGLKKGILIGVMRLISPDNSYLLSDLA